ncbi:GNAT family N-acetyltransferase [Spongiibacter taiwanensis]|uniref:GNAT family N-acetyltransferase n=1 Tax=Spongiibacter taiwanensis TaxID=1748242 RepID=UPI002035CBD2|nr:GNAT family N-acetyltransferase [Spongiibacter taiwanensis]USA41841.1 GNAT family N-acetyltransferase [Spongiibacter taiwanensis]
MQLRVYKETDLPELAALFTRSVHTLGVSAYSPPELFAWAPVPPDLTVWQIRLAWLQVVVAEQEGKSLGFIGYSLDGHIDLLFTDPECCRRGIAKSLYRHVEARLIQWGVSHLTTDASVLARPFFARQGFDVVAEERVERRGQRLLRYRMEKRVVWSSTE